MYHWLTMTGCMATGYDYWWALIGVYLTTGLRETIGGPSGKYLQATVSFLFFLLGGIIRSLFLY